MASIPPNSQYCILFDLDGVLVDTRPVVFDALGAVARALGVPVRGQEALASAVALSPPRAAKLLFPHYPGARALLARAVARRAHLLSPCAGISDLLAILPPPLGVVTSRNQSDADLYLQSSGLSSCFATVVTWGHTWRHKPHPDPILEAARRLSCKKGAYIGDSPGDMKAASAADFVGIGALWASQSTGDELLAAGASVLASEPEDVGSYLRVMEVLS